MKKYNYRAGRIKAKVALDLSLYLRNETAYAPWHSAIGHLFDWAEHLFSDSSHTLMISYIHYLIYPLYLKLGWEDKGSHLDKILRSKIFMVAVDARDPVAIKRAQEMFFEWRHHNKTVPPNLRHVVYTAGVRHGLEADWYFCWQAYNSSTVPSEKRLLLRALAETRDPWILQQYLENTLDGHKIRSQDMLTVLTEVSRNPGGQLAAWRMVRKHWSTIATLFGRGSFTLGAIIQAVTTHFSAPFDLAEVENFFADKNVGPAARALQQSLETIRLHIQWHEDNLEDVAAWLERRASV